MLIREYHESDLHTLRAIHAAQGFDYALPDLSNPLFVTKLVLSGANVAAGGTCPGLAGSPPSSGCDSGHNDHAGMEKAAALKGGATHDRILGAALLRLTAEAYLLLHPRAGTPRESSSRYASAVRRSSAAPRIRSCEAPPFRAAAFSIPA